MQAIEYAQGLLVEEMGEAIQIVGKAIRFGLNTPGKEEAPYLGRTARELLEIELGDVLAAIDYANAAGLVDSTKIITYANIKLAKLANPESKDNLGRRLAPAI